MAKRFKDWLRQAERDFLHAEKSLGMKDFEWSCFAAQQAAEKALKALYDYSGGEAWGHSVLKMLKELPFDVEDRLLKAGAYLDRLYIPARYPNGFAEGIPADYFGEEEAREAVLNAQNILSFAKSKVR